MFRQLVLLSLAVSCHAGTYQQNVPVKVFGDLTCDPVKWFKSVSGTPCTCDTPVKGSTVSVEEGYIQGKDTLACTACGTFTSSFIAGTGVLHIKGTGTIAMLSKALSSVTFKTTSGSGSDRKITYNFGHALYSSKTGHFYEYYKKGVDGNCAGSDCHWDDAQRECADKSRDILGLVGYLITITSSEETEVAKSKLQGQGWIGNSDVAKENEWRWVTGPEGVQGGCAPYDLSVNGPERSACNLGYPLAKVRDGACTGPDCGKGLLIGTGRGSNFQNAPGAYDNWAGSEPNDYSHSCGGSCATTGEDYGHYYNSGKWNDFPTVHPGISGYVCEWGGVGEMCMSADAFSGSEKLKEGPPECSGGNANVPKVQHIRNGGTFDVHGSAVVEGVSSIGPDGTLSSVPFFLKNSGTQYFAVSGAVTGDKLKLTCSGGHSSWECTFYVVVYGCSPCSRDLNGGLSSMISTGDWKARSCGPKFRAAGYDEHPTLILKTEVDSGKSAYTAELTTDAPYLAVFGANCGVEDDWCEKLGAAVLPPKPDTCNSHCLAR